MSNSVGPKSIAIGFNILKLIPSLIHIAEAFGGKGTGAQKKAAVVETVTSLAVAGGAAVATNNPKYADAIGAIIDQVASSLYPKVSEPLAAN